MGRGFVTAPDPNGPSWRISPPNDARTQGLVVSGFNDLQWAEASFLQMDQPGGAWLKTLQGPTSITDARVKVAPAAVIGCTWTGLAKLGLDAKALATCSAPFQEGMHEENRLRRLGDKANGKWQPTVIRGGPLWSGNTPTNTNVADQTPAATEGGTAQTQTRPG